MKLGYDYKKENLKLRFVALKELSKQLFPKAKRNHEWLAKELNVGRTSITMLLNGNENPKLKRKVVNRLNRWEKELKEKEKSILEWAEKINGLEKLII
jgi:hypothetical protein